MSEAGSDALTFPVALTLLSDASEMASVRPVVQQACTQLGFRDPDLCNIVLAIDEALTNVIRHGYEGQGGQPIEIELDRVDREGRVGIQITICDCGRQVDPGTIAGRDLKDIRPGGLGTHIIRSVMDEVEYSQREPIGMQLRMIKQLKG